MDEGFNFDEEIDDFIRFAQRKEFGPSTQSLIKAAEERDIPWIRLNNYSLVQFGHGKFQRRIQATTTSETRHIAVEIACDKEDTHNLLNDLGLPVPKQEMVYSTKGAIRAARRIGFPVVVKPLNANHGRGITINITDNELLEQAFEVAKERGTSRAVLIESFITGLDHRMLVVNGNLIAVAKRVPGHVVGDGKKTIQALVDDVNSDPRRGIGHEKVLTKIEFDYQAERLMADAGYDKTSVLPKGETLYLRSTANLSTGGTAIDMTDVVHPDNREMAIRAIKAVGLDVGGVDFLTQDITQSYKDIGGAIVEVNAAPGFRMHVAPSEGSPRDVAGPVLDMLFPKDADRRIPIAGITGTNGKTTTSRMLAHIFKVTGKTTGLTSTDGVYIDGHPTVVGDMTGPTSAQIVLRDPSVEVAIMETARGGLLRSGLGYRKSDVAACLNVTADHLGLRGIDTVEQLAEIKRTVVEVAQDTAVLNADDEHCLRMADYTQADNLCYVTMNPNHSLVKQHIKSGGRAVVLESNMQGDMITIYDNQVHLPLILTYMIPATIDGKAMHNVQNAMFATAMAYSMNVKLEEIKHGLQTFDTSYFQAPGRMNIYNDHPFKVVLDYAHNPAAVDMMAKFSQKLEIKGRRICILAAPGDRRDQDIRDIAKKTVGSFDYYICKADDNRRGRDQNEVPQMLEKELRDNGINKDRIKIISDEQKAVAHGLKIASEGDLLMIFGDNIKRTWEQIVNHKMDDHDPENIVDINAIDTPTPDSDDSFNMDENVTIIKDERGVRIAKDEDGDD
jgi:cyanophycin synthetase